MEAKKELLKYASGCSIAMVQLQFTFFSSPSFDSDKIKNADNNLFSNVESNLDIQMSAIKMSCWSNDKKNIYKKTEATIIK